jgi:hypothetical protein
VVAVSADGTIVTRGDANRVNDDWGTRQVQVNGLYVATIPWLGDVLPVRSPSGAAFTDRASGAMTITVGSWPAPETPGECAATTFDDVIVGTPGDDTIAAGNGGALVFGLGGNDAITGGNGKDCLVGGDGNDTLSGGNSRDVLLGGEGDDTIYGEADADVLEGGNGKDLLNGGAGVDACFGTVKDTFVGCEPVPTGGSAEPASTTVPSSDPTTTPDPTATPDPTTTADPGPTETPALTPTPDASATSSPDPGASPTSGPAASPSPTAPPTPDSTPTPTPDSTPAPPVVDFTFDVAGLAVSFTNHSKSAQTWTWDFGDGATSTARNPAHTYAVAGAYTVTLIVVGTDGSTGSLSLVVSVAP